MRQLAATLCLLLLAASSARASTCDICMSLVGPIEKGGCDAAQAVCNALGAPLNLVCSYLVVNFCAVIEKDITGGQNATQICTELGYCNNEPSTVQFPCVYTDDSRRGRASRECNGS
jgi:hypothetical protein